MNLFYIYYLYILLDFKVYHSALNKCVYAGMTSGIIIGNAIQMKGDRIKSIHMTTLYIHKYTIYIYIIHIEYLFICVYRNTYDVYQYEWMKR